MLKLGIKDGAKSFTHSRLNQVWHELVSCPMVKEPVRSKSVHQGVKIYKSMHFLLKLLLGILFPKAKV